MVPGTVEICYRVPLHADNRAAWLALRWSSGSGVPAFFPTMMVAENTTTKAASEGSASCVCR